MCTRVGAADGEAGEVEVAYTTLAVNTKTGTPPSESARVVYSEGCYFTTSMG